MPQSPNVPPRGPKVYYSSKGDKRPAIEFRVGGVVIYGRMPGPYTKKEPGPIVPEILETPDKRGLGKRPLMEDPYQLGEDEK